MADDENAKPKSGGGLKRFVITVIVIAVILLATAFLAVRTEGGRSFVEGWLVKRLGMELTIKDAKLTFPLTLVVLDANSKAVEAGGKPVFRAREITVSPTMRGTFSVTVERGSLYLTKSSNGDWTPAVFGRLGEIPGKNVVEITRVMRKLARNLALQVNDSAITWLDEDGSVAAAITGLSFEAANVQLPDRNVRYFRLAADTADMGDDSVVKDVEREWLATEAKDYIELNRIGGAFSETKATFWETDSPVLQKPAKSNGRKAARIGVDPEKEPEAVGLPTEE